MEVDQDNEEQIRRKSNRSPPYALFNLLVIVTAVIYGAYHQMYLSNDEAAPEVENGNEHQKIPLFTADELKKFDGVSKYRQTINHVQKYENDLYLTCVIINSFTRS